jgi:hypothetical protein
VPGRAGPRAEVSAQAWYDAHAESMPRQKAVPWTGPRASGRMENYTPTPHLSAEAGTTPMPGPCRAMGRPMGLRLDGKLYPPPLLLTLKPWRHPWNHAGSLAGTCLLIKIYFRLHSSSTALLRYDLGKNRLSTMNAPASHVRVRRGVLNHANGGWFARVCRH